MGEAGTVQVSDREDALMAPSPPTPQAMQDRIDALESQLQELRNKKQGLLDGPLPKLVGALLVILLLLKSFGVANFSLSTTGALLGLAPLSVLLGSVTSALYLLIPMTAAVLLWQLAVNWKRLGRWRPAVFALATLLVLLSPWHYLWRVAVASFALVLIALILVAVVGWVAGRRGVPQDPFGRRLAGELRSAPLISWPLALLLIAVLLKTLQTPWLPAEAVTFSSPKIISYRDQESALVSVGYVVDTNAGWTEILEAKHRFLMKVPTKDIVRRSTCRVHGQALQGAEPLLYRWTHGPYRSPNRSCEEVERCEFDRLHRVSNVSGPAVVGASYWSGNKRSGANVALVPCSYENQP